MEIWLERLLQRPVAIAATTFAVMVLAVISLLRLPITLLPKLEVPSLVIWTAWPDAPPERIERSVAEPVEEAVAGLSGLLDIESRSQLGGSLVRADFSWNRDLDLAILEVRQQLDRLAGQFPQGVERPLVFPIDPSRRPLWVLALRAREGDGGEETLARLRLLAEEVVARRLEQVEGVARVRVAGGTQRQLEIWLDADRLAAYGLEVDDIGTALASANVAIAGGILRRGPFRYGVELRGELDDERAVADLPITARGRPPVRLHQVADVRWGFAERRGLARLDGREALLLIVEQRTDANSVAAARRLREVLQALERELPAAELVVVADETTFIEDAIGNLGWALAIGGALAAGVLFAFIRRPLPILAVALAIPVSVATTFVFFDLLGISLNLISLSGLALGVGMLVDNAIVVVENIHRLRLEGVSARLAAARGAAEVAVAIASSTLTTIAVFLPLAFAEGLAGRLFRDQSLAVSISLLVSLVVALTLVPLVVSRDESRGKNWEVRGVFLTFLESLGRRSLARTGTVLVGTLIFLGAAGLVAVQLPRQVAPSSGEGPVILGLELPTDAGLELVSARAAALEEEIRRWPEVNSVLADLGQRDDAFLELDPRPLYRGELRIEPRPDAGDGLAARLAGLVPPPDLRLEVRPAEDRFESLLVRQERAGDFSIDLSADLRATADAALPAVAAALRELPELSRVAPAHPQSLVAYRLEFDRDALLRYGVSVDEVAALVESATEGREATRLEKVGESWPLLLRVPAADSLEVLLQQPLSTAEGLMPLSRFLTAREIEVPALLLRHRQTAISRLLADAAPGVKLQVAEAAIRARLAEVLPPGVRVHLAGAGEAFRGSLGSVLSSLLFSLLLVYLILAAQFESLILPLAVLSMVPLALAGVVVALVLTGGSWNLMSLTGCVVLVGIAVNDAIVKVDRIVQLRREGYELEAAVIQAGNERLRPILMTTATTIPGLLPMALSIGSGSELRSPLAVALIGGLLTSTFLTLTVLPALYCRLGRWGNSRRIAT